MERFKIIAFTYKSTELNNLARFFIDENSREEKLGQIKVSANLDEICYVATCNRIEFLIVGNEALDHSFLNKFYKALNPQWNKEDIDWNIQHSLMFSGLDALEHIFNVASSLDSLVVGEREIISQFRRSYEESQKAGLTGDLLRLVEKATVKTAKEIFTHTKIAEKSVSVVFLAYQLLKELSVKLDARFLIIGSGQTNSTMAKYLLKHGFKNFTVFNRTIENGEALAKELNGKAFPISELKNYREGFDVLISCTGSPEHIINPEIYISLLNEDSSKKVLIDLAIPNDIDPLVIRNFNTHLIEIEGLKAKAAVNLVERQNELEIALKIVEQNLLDFKNLLKVRKVELAMKEVPKQIKEIKENAINTIFAKDIDRLDASSKEVLEKVLSYMEKKYISGPMILAKDILIENSSEA